MPLYEYQCRSCNVKTEVLQGMKEPPLTDCDGCGKPELERIIGTGVTFGLNDTGLLRDAFRTREAFDDQDDHRGKMYADKAKAAGISTTGKWYDPSLAIEPGDPGAWVGSISDIIARCKQMGWPYKIEDGNIKVEVPVDFSKNIDQQYKQRLRHDAAHS